MTLEEYSLKHYGKLGMKWGRRKARKQLSYKEQRSKDLANPRKAYKNRNKYSAKEIDRAIGKFKQERELRNLSNDSRRRGANFINSILATGTTAASAYALYKSPMGKQITSTIANKFFANRGLVGL